MTPVADQTKKLEQKRYRLNLIIIALFCSTTLSPCVIFFVRGEGSIFWLCCFLAATFLYSLLPVSFYDKIQLSRNPGVYKALKVPVFKRYATNGDITNRIIRREFSFHSNVKNYAAIAGKIKETYVIEKSHSVLFVFCLLTSIHAFAVGATGLGILLTIGNIVFNFYPNLLQQFNRIRYKAVLNKYARS